MSKLRNVDKIILKASIKHFLTIEQKLLDLKKCIDITEKLSDVLTEEECLQILYIYNSAIKRLDKKINKGG